MLETWATGRVQFALLHYHFILEFCLRYANLGKHTYLAVPEWWYLRSMVCYTLPSDLYLLSRAYVSVFLQEYSLIDDYSGSCLLCGNEAG